MKLFIQKIYRMAENLSMYYTYELPPNQALVEHHRAVAMQENSLVEH